MVGVWVENGPRFGWGREGGDKAGRDHAERWGGFGAGRGRIKLIMFLVHVPCCVPRRGGGGVLGDSLPWSFDH